MPVALPDPSAVVLKGIREDPSPDDGSRVLVDRLWPRGISRERAALDMWAKEATPSTGLRKAFHSGDLPWPEFVEAYRAELAQDPVACQAVAQLRALALGGRLTLLFAGHDHERTHARVLREAILGVPDPGLPTASRPPSLP